MAKTYNERSGTVTRATTPDQLRVSAQESRNSINEVASEAPAEIKGDAQILASAFGVLFTDRLTDRRRRTSSRVTRSVDHDSTVWLMPATSFTVAAWATCAATSSSRRWSGRPPSPPAGRRASPLPRARVAAVADLIAGVGPNGGEVLRREKACVDIGAQGSQSRTTSGRSSYSIVVSRSTVS